MSKNGKHFRYDIFDSRYKASYKSFCEYCERNGMKPTSRNTVTFYRWRDKVRDDRINRFFLILEKINDDEPLILTGELGTPKGRRPIMPMFFDIEPNEKQGTLIRAIVKCITGVREFRLWLKKHRLYIECEHDLGVNKFMIGYLSMKGTSCSRNEVKRNVDILDTEYRYSFKLKSTTFKPVFDVFGYKAYYEEDE